MNKSIKIFLVLFCFTLVLSTPVYAYAAEQEEESETYIEQNERINSLESRLEELGYVIDEVEGTLEQIQDSELEEAEERLVISEKLDLSLLVLNDLVNYFIEFLDKYDASETLAAEHRLFVKTGLVELSELTVSGNTLISDFNTSFEENVKITSENSIKEFNDTLLSTNTLLSYLFVLILFLLVMVIAIAIGVLLHHMLNKFVH